MESDALIPWLPLTTCWRGLALHQFTISEWLDDHQDDDADHQHGRDLVKDAVVAGGPGVAVGGEFLEAARVDPVQAGEDQNEQELAVQPARLPPGPLPGEE